MQQVQIKNNTLNLAVFIDKIDFLKIPNAELSLIASDLELEIFAMVEKRNKRKKQKDKNCDRLWHKQTKVVIFKKAKFDTFSNY